LDKLKAGSTFADIAAADHLKVATLTGIKRGEPPAPLSAAAVDVVFRTAKDALGSGEAAQAPEQVVFRVTGIVVPTPEAASEDAKRTQEALSRSLSEDIFGEYVARLQSEIGVTINQSALSQVVGGGAAGTN
jgi:peptidyl-prolyl cis-trans isomerase D